MLNRPKVPFVSNSLFFGALLVAGITPAIAQDVPTVDIEPANRSAAVSKDDTSNFPEPVFAGWTGAVSLGASTSTGSAETSNVNGSLRVGKRSGNLEHWFSVAAFQGESSVVAPRRGADGEIIVGDNGEPIVDIVRGDTSDRLMASYQPRYFFSDRTYGFLTFDWEKDEPAGIDVSTRQIIGIGHSFYRDVTGFFSIEAGFGNRILENLEGEEFGGGIGYASANYLYRVNENVTFNANLVADFGADNRTVDANLGIKYKLTQTLAFGITHFIRTNSDIRNDANPLSGRRDSVTTVNLVIDI